MSAKSCSRKNNGIINVIGANSAASFTLDASTAITIESDITVTGGGNLNLTIPATANANVLQKPESSVAVDGPNSVMTVTHEGSEPFSFGDGDVAITGGGKFVETSVGNI